MKQSILYKEGYEYNISQCTEGFELHFDYGTRFNKINMEFSHFHPYYEIYILLKGHAQHLIEGRPYNMVANEFVLLKPYLLHKTNYLENTPCKRLIISFKMDLFKKIFPSITDVFETLFENDQPIFRYSDDTNEKLFSLINNMYKLSYQDIEIKDFKMVSYFMQLLSTLEANKDSNKYFLSTSTSNDLEKKIYEITSYIHTNYNEDLSLDYLSTKFYISPHYLSHQFKNITLFSLTQYIHETRVKRAQEMLLDDERKIIDIAESCGFGSVSQFNRVFNKLAGCSPSGYRKMNMIKKS